jgi:hypothetical protein
VLLLEVEHTSTVPCNQPSIFSFQATVAVCARQVWLPLLLDDLLNVLLLGEVSATCHNLMQLPYAL